MMKRLLPFVLLASAMGSFACVAQPALPLDDRQALIETLLERMTLAEKIGQLRLISIGGDMPRERIVEEIAAGREPTQSNVALASGSEALNVNLRNHDADSATPCQSCPVGMFSKSQWAVGRSPRADGRRDGDGFLSAGAGNLVLDLDIGNLTWDNTTASKEAHPSYARENECMWDPCVAGCGCAIVCSAMCEGSFASGNLGLSVSSLAGFSGTNGVRTCGAA